jgi:hypothetical protein
MTCASGGGGFKGAASSGWLAVWPSGAESIIKLCLAQIDAIIGEVEEIARRPAAYLGVTQKGITR